MSLPIIDSSGDVFRDLGFDAKQSQDLRLRSDLMAALRKRIGERIAQGDSQAAIAHLLEVTQPRVSDLVRGKIHLFSAETLAAMLDRLGAEIAVSVISAPRDQAVDVASTQSLPGSFQVSSTTACVAIFPDMYIADTLWFKTSASELVIWSSAPMGDLESFENSVPATTTKRSAASTQLELAA